MCIRMFEGSFCCTKERKLTDLPAVIYACFVLHNFCEENKDVISEEQVRTAVHDERREQPSATTSNKVEGRRARLVLTEYLDP